MELEVGGRERGTDLLVEEKERETNLQDMGMEE